MTVTRSVIGHDFAQLVRDEDDGFALVAQADKHLEKLVGLLRREHGGRLVEDQDLRAAIERLQDFHALLQADRQLRHDGVERHLEAVVAGELLEFAARAPRPGRRRAARRPRRPGRRFPAP